MEDNIELPYSHGSVKNASCTLYRVVAVLIQPASFPAMIEGLRPLLMEVYPKYKALLPDLPFPVDAPTLSLLEEKTKVHHIFNSEDNTQGLILSEEKLLFQSYDASSFSDFSASFEHLLSLMSRWRGLETHKGIAVREINTILPQKRQEDQSLSLPLQSAFLPPSLLERSADPYHQFSRHEYVCKTGETQLLLRVYHFETESGPLLPMDVLPNYVALKEGASCPSVPAPYALADFEANLLIPNKTFPFTKQEILEETHLLQTLIEEGRKKVLTPDPFYINLSRPQKMH